MDFKFVNQNSIYYKQGVALRISLFFNELNSPLTLINDSHENTSFHLACINSDDIVIGTGRLTLENHRGIISQMAIHTDYQRKGIGKKIMNALIEKCADLNVHQIELSARETAIEFYQKFKFKVDGELYPSKKTGIIHQKLTRKLNLIL